MSEVLLLDANVLIALSFTDHLRHRLATSWFGALKPEFATCPMTQGALVRFTLRHIPTGPEAVRNLLNVLASMEGHEFWADDVLCSGLPWRKIFRRRQVTDAYLDSLEKHRGGRLVTLDEALATVFPQAVLITS
jgi:hypothetical protein